MSPAPEAAKARLHHDPFFEPGWIYERKLDGVRILPERSGGHTRLWTRTGRDVCSGFPELVEALEGQSADDFLVDGEIVAFDGPVTSFARLQSRIHVSDPQRARRAGVTVHLYVFDVLRAGGEDVRHLELLERKRVLRGLLDYDDPLRLTPYRRHADQDHLVDACRRGWEGLIAKREGAPYPRGRSGDWLKFKCEAGQEMVIGGWTDPQGSRRGFGALLVGYHDPQGALVYAGKVGTGFSDDVLQSLGEQLASRELAAPPFARGHLPSRSVHWVAPELVCQVAFTEWTSAGQLRHPRYLGLRTDKDPGDVVRE